MNALSSGQSVRRLAAVWPLGAQRIKEPVFPLVWFAKRCPSLPELAGLR
jgi:hypothetical protein